MLTIVRAVAFTAAGQPEQARACLDAALQSADNTGCISTTPNCCGHAPTPTTNPRNVELTSAPLSKWPAARAPPCSNCAPPWAYFGFKTPRG